MRKLIAVIIFTICAFAVQAQDATTNALKTEIENLEAQTNTIIVKAFGAVGSVSISSGTLAIRCKETSDVTHGRKLYGLILEATVDSRFSQSAIVDEDELDSLADGLDYLAKISYDVTTLPAFTAEYATKSGLRFIAHSNRKQSGIQFYLQIGDGPRIPLDSTQLAQFNNLLGQFRNTLNALKPAK
jgi:hypothetical protein